MLRRLLTFKKNALNLISSDNSFYQNNFDMQIRHLFLDQSLISKTRKYSIYRPKKYPQTEELSVNQRALSREMFDIQTEEESDLQIEKLSADQRNF